MPILDEHALDFISYNYDQTLRYGVKLGQLLKPRDLVCLSGQLGAGKTALAIGIGRGWGALQPVTSPSYVLANEYSRADGTQLHHLDCFRLADASDAEHICFDERLAAGASLMVEWPANIAAALPRGRLWVGMSYFAEEKRGLEIRASGERFERLLAGFRKTAFQHGDA
jgi:tRNA threonylcarbamoyladenosine biosynthesis protein TsaE